MKKFLKVVLVIIAFAAVFTLGCFMPKIWPKVLNKVIYPVFPQLKTASAEADLYTPYSNAELGDPISETDSVIYYFYKDYCPWCKQLEPLTAGLPKEITLPDGTTSRVKLICLNKVEDRYLEPLLNTMILIIFRKKGVLFLRLSLVISIYLPMMRLLRIL